MKLFATLFFTVIFSVSGAWCYDSSDEDDYHGDRPRRAKTTKIKRPRLDPKAKEILEAWYEEHSDDPYPPIETKNYFIQKTGLSMDQINNWFGNTQSRGLRLREGDLGYKTPEKSSKRRKVISSFDNKNKKEDAQTADDKTVIKSPMTKLPKPHGPSLKEPKSSERNIQSLYSLYDDPASDRLILGNNSEMPLVNYNDDIGTWESYFNSIDIGL